jgi:hypothetical protein
MKTDSYVARDLLNAKIVYMVNDYIENSNVYPQDSCIAIKKKSLEIELFTPAEADPRWETYPIASFIRQNESQDGFEADIDATYELEGKYYFVK